MRILIAILALACMANRSHALNLHATTNAYDYVIIAHDSFASSLSGLVTLRESSTGLRTCIVRNSEIASEFGSGSLTADNIQEFIRYAVENWAVTPTYFVLVGDANTGGHPDSNLVPAFYDDLGRPAESRFVRDVDDHILARLGRIPCQNATQLANYLAKAIGHESSNARGDWERKALILYGDKTNTNIRDREDQVTAVINQVQWLSTSVLASRFYGVHSPDAENATLTEWNAGNGSAAGKGLVVGFGFPYDEQTDLVQMADFDLAEAPTFTQRVAANGHYPLVLAPTCNVNRYFTVRNNPWSVPEDLLLARANAGAIGAIASGTDSYVEDNIAITDLVMKTIGTQHGELDPGRLVAIIWEDFIDRPWIPTDLSLSYSLLGDPASKLYFPNAPSVDNWSLGFEVKEQMSMQNAVLGQGGAPTGINSKVVTGNVMTPVEGHRSFSVRLTPSTSPTTDDFVEWEVVRPNFLIGPESYLTYYERVDASPGGHGAVSIDGQTADGVTLRSVSPLRDQHGVMLNAETRGTPSGSWRPIYIDLSPLQGKTIASLRIRYEDKAVGDQGELRYFVDSIRLTSTTETDDAFNGGFESTGPPMSALGWEKIPTVFGAMGGVVSDLFPASGTRCMLVVDADCNGQGIAQVVTIAPYEGYYQSVQFKGRGPGNVRVKIRQGSANWAVIDEEIVSLSSNWSTGYVVFANPDWEQWSQCRIEFAPDNCNNSIYIDDVVVTEPYVTGTNGEELSHDALLVVTHPSVASEHFRLLIRASKPGTAQVECFDVLGRRLSRWQGSVGEQERVIESSSLDLHSARGVYFIRSSFDGQVIKTSRITIIR